jgi:hypothetical protein
MFTYAFRITLFWSVAKSSLDIPLYAISSLAIRGSTTVNWSRNCQPANLYSAIAERVTAVTIQLTGARAARGAVLTESTCRNHHKRKTDVTGCVEIHIVILYFVIYYKTLSETRPSDWMIGNNKLEAVVAYFKMLPRNLFGENWGQWREILVRITNDPVEIRIRHLRIISQSPCCLGYLARFSHLQ